MIVLGLTGSIGMGKTTTAAMFRRLRVPVHDADGCVHRLLGPGGAAVAAVAAQFAGVVRNGAVDRAALRRQVFGRPDRLAALEAILHPLVRQDEQHFVRQCGRQHRPLVVLDIPLLYETGAERRCDLVAVVSAPAFIQTQRVLARTGMTRSVLADILARQMADSEKRRRAEVVIPTGLGRAHTFLHVRRLVGMLEAQSRAGARNTGRPARRRRLFR